MLFPLFVPTLQDPYSLGEGSWRPDSPIEIPHEVALMGLPQNIQFTWMNSSSRMVLHIAQPGSSALYSADMPQGWNGPTILYAGSRVQGNPMLYVERSGHESTFHLPGVPTCGIMPCQIVLQCEYADPVTWFRFTMVVGDGTNNHFETFEWRRSSKSAGKWKLTRLGPGAEEDMSQQWYPSPYGQEYYGSPVATDGGSSRKETVAILSEEKASSRSSHRSKVGGFQFKGSGATSELGYHWALMATMSGILILQLIGAGESRASG
ncbi:hypothetical protein CDV36_013793 [Fusarium kuroshium]|uniref:Uncharacterized protein n=5 Tax=Fusarium solani species complex TaxID=232080 RepID=A0A3M2RMP8_9HYPO|nr:hypothetical protein CDV36_013793 [Fusarium kuroshium]RSL82405.1 hypothetical protein CDV31_016938 [Fusarium ambrosium]RSM08786.1 hypothetical protein CEP52_004488 [Fusarium oligoseptatum]